MHASFAFPNDKQNFENNEDARIPKSFAGLIVGKRNCGKTHLLFQLLLEGYIDYNRLYIFSPSIAQSEYQLIVEGFKQHLMPQDIWVIFQNIKDIELSDPKEVVKKMVEEHEREDPSGSWKSKIEVFAFKDGNAIPRPEEVDKKFKNLFIFDDCMLESQSPIESYYTRGRHSSVQCLYISQSYFEIPKKTIRDNSSLVILFKLPTTNLWHVYNDHFSTDMTWKSGTFQEFAKGVWDKKYEYMVIDTDNQDMEWRYRKGFYTPFSEVV
jgi:hypothetical protein